MGSAGDGDCARKDGTAKTAATMLMANVRMVPEAILLAASQQLDVYI